MLKSRKVREWFFLFVFDENREINEKMKSLELPYEIFEFTPSFLKVKLLNFSDLKDFLIHYFWFFITKGKYRIVYMRDNSKIIHSTYILPRIYKFSFMAINDFEIGPCYTEESYRGQGIYSFVLTYIISKFGGDGKRFYMIVLENNISSQKGVIKAGFVKSGVVYKNILGIYKKEV
jgi:hypothetical protein